MSRTLPAAVDTAVQDANVRGALFVEFDFASGFSRLWSGVGDLVWNGKTFTGAGDLGEVIVVEETTEIKAVGLTFTLSGLPSALVATAIGEHYQGRNCSMWLGFFDTGWALIADPVLIFSGRMDVMAVADAGGTASIKITVENRLIDLERPNQPRFDTDQDHQAEFPGDRGFEFVTAMQEAQIVWGNNVFGPSSPGPPIAVFPGPGDSIVLIPPIQGDVNLPTLDSILPPSDV